MKKLLVIGFQKYDERMYPHLYDVLNYLGKNFELTYYDGDDRGKALRSVPVRILPMVYYLLFYLMREIIRRYRILKIARDKFDIVIAIDHTALNLASQYFGRKSKLVFWSFDYVAPESAAHQHFFIRRLLQGNRKNIQKYSLIIIQNRNRGKRLDQLLGCFSIPHYYLPVSLSDNTFSKKVSKDRTKKHLTTKIALMQITAHSKRYANVVLNAYQSFSKNITLILQGDTSHQVIDLLNKLGRKPLVLPVCGTIAEMQKNIARADIGLLCYPARDSNEKYTLASSGQMVEFLRLGIPVIVYKHRELGEYVKNQGIGVYIHNFSEIGGASKIIVRNYAQFSSRARMIYEQNFNIDRFTSSLVEKLASLD